MKKIELFIVVAVLAISALALAEDKTSTASTPETKTTPQQIPDTILYKAASIGANCATDETIRTILARDTQSDKTETNNDTAHNEKQTQESVSNINKCILDGISKMKAEMAASR